MRKPERPRIAILGAGPIGLEAALYARTLDFPVAVYERGRLADFVQRWGHVRLFSPFAMSTTPLGRNAILQQNQRHELPDEQSCVTGRELFSRYLEPLSKLERLRDCVHLDTHVVAVARHGYLKMEAVGDAKRGKQPFRLMLRQGGKERQEAADIVLDCTGTYGKHRWLGDGGIPALGELAAEQHIAYGLEDILGERRNHYAGKYTLLVGGGYSAATTACQLMDLAEKHPDMWVIWATRGQVIQPLRRIPGDPLREREKLALRANNLATRGEGNLEFHAQTVIDTIEHQGDRGFKVHVRVAGEPRTWEVERLIANVGYGPDTSLYRELQVHECYASLGPMKLAAALFGQRGEDCMKQTSHGIDTLRSPEPNFFILGAKSYGLSSTFLLRVGFEQIREVFAHLTGQAALDLYR